MSKYKLIYNTIVSWVIVKKQKENYIMLKSTCFVLTNEGLRCKIKDVK